MLSEPLRAEEDAFGHVLMDHLRGHPSAEIVERDDGYLGFSASSQVYFQVPEGVRRQLADHATGRVLDVGCGAGRYSLYLQECGRDVVAIDASPLAVEVCRERGLVDVRLLTLAQVGPKLGAFDSVILMGHNFGLVANAENATEILRAFSESMTRNARIVAETLDPYMTDDPDHLAYHARNRELGRMGGQIRMRIRYKKFRTPWFDYLFVSRAELESIVADTDWELSEVISDGGPTYAVVLRRSK